MDETDQKLDKFFSHLYAPMTETERARRVRRELENWIRSALAPDSPEKKPAWT